MTCLNILLRARGRARAWAHTSQSSGRRTFPYLSSPLCSQPQFREPTKQCLWEKCLSLYNSSIFLYIPLCSSIFLYPSAVFLYGFSIPLYPQRALAVLDVGSCREKTGEVQERGWRRCRLAEAAGFILMLFCVQRRY